MSCNCGAVNCECRTRLAQLERENAALRKKYTDLLCRMIDVQTAFNHDLEEHGVELSPVELDDR